MTIFMLRKRVEDTLSESVCSLFFGFLAALFLGASLSMSVKAQTLQEAMLRAYEQHPALSAQRAGVRALDEDIDQARAGWRPSISVSTGTGHHSSTYKYQAGPTVKHDRHASDLRLSASQPLLNWTTRPGVEAAEARMLQGQADLLEVEQQVMLEVATAYLNVLQYRRLLDLHEDNVSSLDRQVSYRSEHFERRLGTRTELAQARARHAGAVAQRDSVQAELEISTSAFLRHVGMVPGELIFPEDLPALPKNLDVIVEDAAYRQPAVRSAHHGVQAAQADAEVAEGRLKPTLNLEAAGGWMRRPDQGLHSSRDASVQLTLRIPIYQAGADRAQVRSSKQRLVQQQSHLRDSRLQARYDAANAWRKLHAARAEIDAFSKAVAANKVAYEGVEAEYAALGELTLIEVLNAQQELFMSEVSLLQARTLAALSHLQLLAAQGRLTAKALGLFDDAPEYEPRPSQQDQERQY